MQQKFSLEQLPRIKLSVRIVSVIAGLLGLLILIYSSKTLMPRFEEKLSSIEAETEQLKVQEQQLTELYENMEFYTAETERLNKDTQDTLNKFPSFLYLEDKILYAHNLLTNELNGFSLQDMSYGDSQFVMNTEYGEGKTMELYSVSLSAKYSAMTYKQMKDLLNYGLKSSQRFVIDSFNAAYNEDTGYLSGQFTFSTYFIAGQQNKPYKFPDEVESGLGTSNREDDLFGTRTNPPTQQ